MERAIREHQGYLASSPELKRYLKPPNWTELLNAMREKNSALIIGQSGTGKMLATPALYDELRQEIRGLARVPIHLGPHQLRNDEAPPPVLFDIEDSWARIENRKRQSLRIDCEKIR